tara:strand:- start:153 stop:911 length:759 start_codon:yes stop_codon:yes gene_type:complete
MSVFGQQTQTPAFGRLAEEASKCLVKFTANAKISILLRRAPANTPGTADQAYLQVCTEGNWRQECECAVDDPDQYPRNWVESPGIPCCSHVEGTIGPAEAGSDAGVVAVRHVDCYKYCDPKDGGCSVDETCLGRAGGDLEDRTGKTKCCGPLIKISTVAIDLLGSNCQCPQNDMVEKLRCINENCFDGSWERTIPALIDILEAQANDMGGVNNFWRDSCKCFLEMKSVAETKNPCSKLSCGNPSRDTMDTRY